jgi:stearoyl-CoA desaturase (Delta-9 desaturase)
MSLLGMGIVTLAILQMSVFFTTIYLHRTKTHRGLELNPVVGLLMHLELSLFTGVVPRQWVAVHRKHHKFSDKELDPHSPLVFGMWHVLFGNYFYYRRVANDPLDVERYTTDWKNDPLDRLPLMNFAVFGGLAIFILMFGIWWGLAAWLAHAVLYVFLNSAINSLGHTVGYKNFNRQQATNLRSLALLTAGEGLHNNHHEFPGSGRFTHPTFLHRRMEIDLGWLVILGLQACGLARVKNVPIAKPA